MHSKVVGSVRPRDYSPRLPRIRTCGFPTSDVASHIRCVMRPNQLCGEAMPSDGIGAPCTAKYHNSDRHDAWQNPCCVLQPPMNWRPAATPKLGAVSTTPPRTSRCPYRRSLLLRQL